MKDKSHQTRQLEIGDRVFIVGNHPWTGHSGTLIAVEILHAIGEPGCRIRLDNGIECFVLQPGLLQRA